MSLNFRQASADDATSIARIMQVSTLENNPDTARIARLISEHTPFVAEEDGEIGGFVDASATTAADGKVRWEVDLLGVDPEWQGRGIARKLVEAAVNEGRRQGISIARALVRTTNKPAQRAFAWCAFQPLRIPFYLYTAEPADTAVIEMPPDAHLIRIETLTYSGVWLEDARSTAAFQAARALVYRYGGSTAGAVIAADDLAALEAAEHAGYVSVGEYDWWERSISDAASAQS